MAEDFLTYGVSPDPKAWAEIDREGKLLFFDEARAREFVAVNDPLLPSVRIAWLILNVLQAERERVPFNSFEFLEV